MIAINGESKVNVSGESNGLTAWWLEDGKPVKDMSEATPTELDHYFTVSYWVRSLDVNVDSHVLLLDAGLFPAGDIVMMPAHATAPRLEHLRRSVVGETTQCRKCWSAGMTDNGHHRDSAQDVRDHQLTVT